MGECWDINLDFCDFLLPDDSYSRLGFVLYLFVACLVKQGGHVTMDVI